MILRVSRNALAAFLILLPAMAPAGDGTFGVPSSGILPPPPPKQTASLIPPERADVERQRPVTRVQQTYSPAPADGAGRSRVVPPSEAPEHSPIVVPPKKKQFKAPVATLDPAYVATVTDGQRSDAPEPGYGSTPVPNAMPVMAQGAAPEPKRGLFTSPTFRSRNAAAAAYEEHTSSIRTAPQQTLSAPVTAIRQGPGSVRIARNGTPCAQLRGVFTSPPECR
jgi:hypothetical protein